MERYYTVEETAAILGVSKHTIYHGVNPKTTTPFPIQPKRIGRLLRFPESRIRAFMEKED